MGHFRKLYFLRQVRDQECNVETAGEEPGIEQQIAAVAERAAKRGHIALAIDHPENIRLEYPAVNAGYSR